MLGQGGNTARKNKRVASFALLFGLFRSLAFGRIETSTGGRAGHAAPPHPHMMAASAEAAHARGAIPNPRWRNPRWTDMRLNSTLPSDPLPFRPRSLAAALPTTPADHASIRQTDRALTRALHNGVLTGGRLLAYLGFRDAPAAARLGLPPPKTPGAAFAAAAADVAGPLWDAATHGLVELDPAHDEAEASGLGLQRPLHPGAAAAVADGGPGAVALVWGSEHEPAALAALAAALAPAGSRVGEAGLCRVTERTLSELGLDLAATPLPPLGASPDALVAHFLTQPCVDGVLRRAGEEEGAEDAAHSLPPVLIRAPAAWREVVEVKSVCPFTVTRRGHPGAPRFTLADPGPRSTGSKSLARALPQLQLEMLCAGVTSGLLASASATRGVRVWRSARDDAYLKRLLECVVSPAFVATRGLVSEGSIAPPASSSKKKNKRKI